MSLPIFIFLTVIIYYKIKVIKKFHQAPQEHSQNPSGWFWNAAQTLLFRVCAVMWISLGGAILQKTWILNTNKLWFQSHLCHVLTMWPYISYWVVPKLHFLTWKMGKQPPCPRETRPREPHWYHKSISVPLGPWTRSPATLNPSFPEPGVQTLPFGPVPWHVVPLPAHGSHQWPDLGWGRAGSQHAGKAPALGRGCMGSEPRSHPLI